jgi:hypothetical protein
LQIAAQTSEEQLNQDVLRLTNQYIETRMELAAEREHVDELLGSPRLFTFLYDFRVFVHNS